MMRFGSISAPGIFFVLACGPSVDVPADSAGATSGSGSASSSSDVDTAPSSITVVTATTFTSDSGSVVTQGDIDETAVPITEDDGVIFNVFPDYGTQPPIDCGLLEQNCPPGFKCMPWSGIRDEPWNSVKCFPVVRDPAQVGEPCSVQESPYSGLDDCDVGLACWHVGPDHTGVCEDMCILGGDGLPACADPDEVCVVAYYGSVALCVTACDPLMPSCPPGQGCYPAERGWGCFVDDLALGGVHGDPCPWLHAAANACDAGHVCAPTSAFTACEDARACCTPVCDLLDPDANSGCAALDPAQTCVPGFEPPVPEGYEHVGVCAIAP